MHYRIFEATLAIELKGEDFTENKILTFCTGVFYFGPN